MSYVKYLTKEDLKSIPRKSWIEVMTERLYPDYAPDPYDTCYDTGDNLGECDCTECPYADDCTYAERGEEE